MHKLSIVLLLGLSNVAACRSHVADSGGPETVVGVPGTSTALPGGSTVTSNSDSLFKSDRKVRPPRGLIPTVGLKINGHDAQLWFDTGAATTVLRPAAANRVGLNCTGSVQIFKTPGGDVSGRRCDPTVVMATATRKADRLAITSADLPGIPDTVDGLLGFDFAKLFVVQLGPDRFSLFNPEEFHSDERSYPLKPNAAGYFVDVSIETVSHGTVEISLEIDTGNIYDLSLPPMDAVLDGSPKVDLTGTNASGAENVPLYMVASVRFAGQVFASSNVALLPAGYPFGLIGMGILDNYIVTLDYSQHRMWLAAVKK